MGRLCMQVDGKAGPYEFITYAQAGEMVAGVGAALMAAGLEARRKCAIYGVNCVEWMIAMQVSKFPRFACMPNCGPALGPPQLLSVPAWHALSVAN